MANEMNTMINETTNSKIMEDIISTRTTIGAISVVKVRTNDLNPYRVAINGEIVTKIGSEITETDKEGRNLKAKLTFTNPNGEKVLVEGGYTDEALIASVKKEWGL